MTAHISAQERTLIDAAIADGKLTKVPEGANTQPEYRWCSKVRKLVQVDGMNVSWRDGRKRVDWTRRPDVIAAAARRHKIPALIERGMTGPMIAEELGVSVEVIRSDCKRMKISLVPAVNKTREAVKAFYLANPDATRAACARAIGSNPVTVSDWLRKLRAAGEIPGVAQ